jgi:uncharacterized protein YbaP (TraB family)
MGHKTFVLVMISVLLICFSFSTAGTNNQTKHFLWKISKGQAVCYILGSIHLLKKEMYPLAAVIEESFRKSSALVLEIDLSAMGESAMAADLMKKALFADKKTLKDHLQPEQYEKIKKTLKTDLDMNLDLYQNYKPWFTAMTIQAVQLCKLGFSPEHGLDMYFFNKAKGKKQIIGFETLEFQANLLNTLTMPQQMNLLLYTVEELNRFGKMMDEIICNWQTGDADRLEQLILAEAKTNENFASILKIINDDRNIMMVKNINQFLSGKGTYFIVVGAAHLVGENGIIESLKKQGLIVSQL